MNNSAEIERLLALRPFDKKGFEDVHERIRTQMNTLKSAQRGFNNQDAIDPLLIIAHTAMESAEKLLDEDAESFDRATRTAAKQALFALSEAIASNRIRMAKVAASAFDAQIESTVMTLSAASAKAMGRDLTQKEHDSLKNRIREFFQGMGPMPGIVDAAIVAAGAAVASGNLAKVDTQPAEQDAFVLTPA